MNEPGPPQGLSPLRGRGIAHFNLIAILASTMSVLQLNDSTISASRWIGERTPQRASKSLWASSRALRKNLA